MGKLMSPVDLDFSGTPVLEFGTDLQPGAQYRYSNVATGIDALVEIIDSNNAALVELDQTSQGILRLSASD